jgi:NAD(P)-dependent dehydrogenase (short-subunit alcohol dehydrogenase family)
MNDSSIRSGRRLVRIRLRNASLPIETLNTLCRDDDQIAEAFRVVTEGFGVDRLDVLINNAGVAVPGPLETLPIEDVADQFDVNLLGVLRVTQRLKALLVAAPFGFQGDGDDRLR